jgi:hypothetical protein
LLTLAEPRVAEMAKDFTPKFNYIRDFSFARN